MTTSTLLPVIDTHAHLYLCKQPLDELLDQARQNNVCYMVNVALGIASTQTSWEMSRQYPQLIPTAGIHPCEVKELSRISELEALLTQHSFRAIGEIGLDYYHTADTREEQIRMFCHQLELARQHNLPVIIHNRESDTDMRAILKDFSDVTKVIHCFSSGQDFIEDVANENTYFSFTGTITYSQKSATLDALKDLPLDRIMIETDSPYLTPTRHKGAENQPAFVREMADRIAEIKSLPIETVIEATTRTACQFFNIALPAEFA